MSTTGGHEDPRPRTRRVDAGRQPRSLTLDWKLQEVAEHTLSAQLEELGPVARTASWPARSSCSIPTPAAFSRWRRSRASIPNDFVNGISVAKYAVYHDNPLNPLFNRAIAATSPTGSTFKLVTGSAAITTGAIKPPYVLYDSGSWECHGATFTDLAAGGLGSTNFIHALAASSDGYFYQLGDRLGHERLRRFALLFGLNAKSGIDIPGEDPGNWPTDAWMQKVYGLPLEPSDVCQLGIGQGAMQATPLQMASIVSSVANGGRLFRPHIVQEILDPAGHVIRRFDHELIRKIPVTPEALDQVRTGMSLVTHAGGTGYGLAVEGVPFGAKTGTAETEGGRGPNTTWFVAFAPLDHPKIAMAIYMEKSGSYGATVAGPIAHDVIAAYLLSPSPSPSPTPSPTPSATPLPSPTPTPSPIPSPKPSPSPEPEASSSTP